MPVGSVVMHAGALPSGWLECDAAAVSRTTYAKLFAVTGTTFGVGDGSTTFNLPDLRGRSPVGLGTGDHVTPTNRSMADKAGDEVHALTSGEGPVHNHGFVGADGAVVQNGAGAEGFAGGPNAYLLESTTQNAGSGTAHNTMHPVLALRMIIFAGA
jgi:microcystin-dependent protein